MIETYHATKQKPRKTDSYNELKRLCHQHNLPFPHYQTFVRRLKDYDPCRLRKTREGTKRAHDQQGAIPAHFEAQHPLELIQIDHTRVDLIVVDRIRREALGRPWLTLAVDIYSRVVVGFHIAFEVPSATTVALCLAHACLDKYVWLAERGLDLSWPFAGVPDAIHLDNAREFHAKALQYGCAEHGIIINYRPVATPHYGGHIERLIGTLMGKVHLLPGTTFSNIVEKGDYASEAHASLTLPEFERWLALEIASYHDSVHRTLETTPRAMWCRGVERQGDPRHVSNSSRFSLDFMPFAYRKLRRDGIYLHGLRYWSDTLGLWLGRLAEKCLVRYDPRDLTTVWIRLPNGDDIAAHYADLRWSQITLWELRVAQRALRAQGIAAADPDAVFRIVEKQRALINDARIATRRARHSATKQDEARRAATTHPPGGNPVKQKPAKGQDIDYSQVPIPFKVEIWES
ncbi:MAG: transposase [Phycisphaerales bacterium]|nr:transposase [Phycisphaerales bacterium]